MSTNVSIVIPDTTSDRAEGSALLAQAESLRVTDAATLEIAGAFVRQCASAKKAVEARLAPAIDSAFAAHRAMTGLRADLVGPFERARSIAEPRIVAYQREEQARLDVERREAEARARKAAEEAQLAAAIEAESEGQSDVAEAILSEAPIIFAAPAAAAPKVDGMTARVTYSARVVDLVALIRYVAANPAESSFLLPNIVALNAIARTHKGLKVIPGVEVVATSALSVRS